jgi:RNA polymerase sigma factor (sigma-70 family)
MTIPSFDLHQPYEDQYLVQQIRSGDYAAFTQLYNKYAQPLTQYGLKFNAGLPVIEDSLHDVFVWVWANRHKLEVRHSIKSYLFKAVRTSILHALEKTSKFRSLEQEEENSYHFELELSPEGLSLQNENLRLVREQVANLLNRLTAKQKEVIYLRYYEELCFEDIAANMNLSVKACYKIMGRAITTLRENIPHSRVLLIFLLCLQRL